MAKGEAGTVCLSLGEYLEYLLDPLKAQFSVQLMIRSTSNGLGVRQQK